MTLDNLLRIGKLKAHAADRTEIARLLAAAERALADSAVAGLSSDTRLDAAYRAIMQAALIAMLANGYRPATSEAGHHQLLVQALPKTADVAADRVRVLDAFRAARNQSDYRGVPVSDSVAAECAVEARKLLADVRAWLASHRPELL
jgi:glutamine synthetase type III